MIAGIALNLIYAVLTLAFITVTVLFLIWLERKISAHMQSRLGPMRVGGWHGWAQTIADAIKLFLKEDIIPLNADKPVHRLAPLVVFIPVFIAFAVVPIGANMIIADLNTGALFIFSICSIPALGIIMAGWSSNNKYTLMGAIRAAAQMISYEIPMILSVLGVIMLTGSLKMSDIVNAQSKTWFIFVQPIGFIVYLIASLAETFRIPFDLPEAESELVAGYHTEYSGLKFAFFFLAEFAKMFLVAMLAVTFFLGGWLGPVLPGPVWFLIKTYAIIFLFMWARWTLPRLRIDRLMNFGWKVLIPFAFLNILVTGLIG
ncbi:MAG: NADH-quinone oxidoreductase subunit NuoH [Candidatus Omnitrophota bacterium]